MKEKIGSPIENQQFTFPKMKRFRLILFIRRKYYLCLCLLLLFLVVHYSGAIIYLSQCDLEDASQVHPVNRPNLTSYVSFYHRKLSDFAYLDQVKSQANRQFEFKTLDDNFNHRFIIENPNKCANENSGEIEEIRLLILIKSAIPNRKQRDMIRRTWADQNRFSDVKVRSMFSLGSCDRVSDADRAKLDMKNSGKACQDLMDEENQLNNDLIQIDFVDNYYNNTIKTLNGIKWIVKNCPRAQFVLLIDDDYYLSVKNLLRHISWLNYDNEEKQRIAGKSDYEKSLISHAKPRFDPYTEDLYSGWVFNSSVPCRYRFSKWFVNLDEYPFSRWPPYVTAGFVLLSNRSLKSIYFASLYTKVFRFDDIYLSILARKSNIRPLHLGDVHFYKRAYGSDGAEYENIIGSHGFKDGNEMMQLWMLMKSKGFA